MSPRSTSPNEELTARAIQIFEGNYDVSGENPSGFRLYTYAAETLQELESDVAQRRTSLDGRFRIALICSNADEEETHRRAIGHCREPQSDEPNIFSSHQSLDGELAFVFNGMAAAYSGAARELVVAVPELVCNLSMRCTCLNEHPRCLRPGLNALTMSTHEQVFASILTGILHSEWTLRMAQIQPQAAIGLSVGETSAFLSFQVWKDLDSTFHRLEDGPLLSRDIGGEWRAVEQAWLQAGAIASGTAIEFTLWRVMHPVAELQHWVLSRQPLVRISMIHTDRDCIICGQRSECERFFNEKGIQAVPLGPGLSVHTPDMTSQAEAWRHMHDWPSFPSQSVRFYSHATNKAYIPTREAAAEASVGQAINPVDFRATINQAYQDGVRVFVEHGPRNLCSQWISEILGDRPHRCLCMDQVGVNSYKKALEVLGALWAWGETFDLEGVFEKMPNAIKPPPSVPRVHAPAAPSPHPSFRQAPRPRSCSPAIDQELTRVHTAYLDQMMKAVEAITKTQTVFLNQLVGNGMDVPNLPIHLPVESASYAEIFEQSQAYAASWQSPLYRGRLLLSFLLDVWKNWEMREELDSFSGWLVFHRTELRPGDEILHTWSANGPLDTDLPLSCKTTVAHEPSVEWCIESIGNSLAMKEKTLSRPDSALPAEEIPLKKHSLTREEVRSFADGDLRACFGESHRWTATHTRSPAIPPAPHTLVDSVPWIIPPGEQGSPGCMKAEKSFPPQQAQVLSTALLLDGAFQCMALYMAGLGLTLKKDAWIFEPAHDRKLTFQVRDLGQPCGQLRYALTITHIENGLQPCLSADVNIQAGDRDVFRASNVSLQLAPGWPMEDEPMPDLRPEDAEAMSVGDAHGHSRAMLSCSIGRASKGLGSVNADFDVGRRFPRLPVPPFLFISRITKMPIKPGTMKAGGHVESKFDFCPQDWFFLEHGAPSMPFAVLLEAILQTCGWLGTHSVAGVMQREMFFRNLDGVGDMKGEVDPNGGCLVTQIHQTKLVDAGEAIIEAFTLECAQDDRLIFTGESVFGFFSEESLATQQGLKEHEGMNSLLRRPSSYEVDCSSEPDRYFSGACRLAKGRLRMIDTITGFWEDGGSRGLGALRSEKLVDPGDWFFKAHFFQDPVQPGSLGLEAMLQLLQFYMLETKMFDGFDMPRMQIPSVGQHLEWIYRGQVLPVHEKIEITMEITDRQHTREGSWAEAEASLWVDERRIYHAKGLRAAISLSA